jgi:hypothetical protein
MAYCDQCGEEIQAGAHFCPFCGREAAGTPATDHPPGPKGAGGIFWSNKMGVITSTVVIKQLILAFGGGCLFVLIILLAANPSAAAAFVPVIAAIFGFFVILGLIIAAAIHFGSGGGPEGFFAVTPKGVGYRAGKLSKDINRATLIGSAVGGSLTGAGGSLVNISRELDFMDWKEIRSATAYTRDRTILLYRKVLFSPIILYCTPENFDAVINYIREHAPDAKFRMKGW